MITAALITVVDSRGIVLVSALKLGSIPAVGNESGIVRPCPNSTEPLKASMATMTAVIRITLPCGVFGVR